MALTRASKNAIITFSKKRRFNNAWINSAGPSRYVYFVCVSVCVCLSVCVCVCVCVCVSPTRCISLAI